MTLLIPVGQKKNVEEKVVDITNGKTLLQSVEEVFYAPVEGEIKVWKIESKKD